MPVKSRYRRPIYLFLIAMGGLGLSHTARADSFALNQPTSMTGTVIIDKFTNDTGERKFIALKPDSPIGTVSGTSLTPVPKNRSDLQLVDLDYGTAKEHHLDQWVGKHCVVTGVIDTPDNGNQAPRLQFQVDKIADSPAEVALPKSKTPGQNGPVSP